MNYCDPKDELLHAMLDADEAGDTQAFEMVLRVVEQDHEEYARACNEYRSFWRKILAHG